MSTSQGTFLVDPSVPLHFEVVIPRLALDLFSRRLNLPVLQFQRNINRLGELQQPLPHHCEVIVSGPSHSLQLVELLCKLGQLYVLNGSSLRKIWA